MPPYCVLVFDLSGDVGAAFYKPDEQAANDFAILLEQIGEKHELPVKAEAFALVSPTSDNVESYFKMVYEAKHRPPLRFEPSPVDLFPRSAYDK